MKRTRFIVPTPFTLGSSALQKVRNRRPQAMAAVVYSARANHQREVDYRESPNRAVGGAGIGLSASGAAPIPCCTSNTRSCFVTILAPRGRCVLAFSTGVTM
jgi:hypothetical protein